MPHFFATVLVPTLPKWVSDPQDGFSIPVAIHELTYTMQKVGKSPGEPIKLDFAQEWRFWAQK